jgi:biotin transport system substrate-specific component
MSSATLADRLVPVPGIAKEVLLVLGGTAVTALLAQVSVPLPFTPVPVTLQTLAVLLVGASLGGRRGALSEILYVLLGAAGLPFFAGGTGGTAHLLGPTGGYLVGFVAAAYLAGKAAERRLERRLGVSFLTMAVADLAIYLFGLPWLGLYVGFGRVLLLGFVPFLAGDLVKILLASSLLPLSWRLVSR